ncbi:MAG: TonB-dependent receptor, partial [Acidobacterium ailaaui]|nr:TonB-dependent receptor [Pseudacidobacterium ailaaui]
IRITGVVRDSLGNPLAGVTVKLKGTNTGTVTDAQGRFSIEVPNQQAILVFTYVGYQTQEIPVSAYVTGQELAVTLHQQASALNELVVVGYGTQRRKDLTGSISTISADQLKDAALSTPDQALQGRVSGVSVSTDSHAPGGGISVRVRGVASIGASGSPLYVIDGVPIVSNFSTGFGDPDGQGGDPNPLNSIDPSDIASIEVLKDASATAIYGSRGANGVVIITTKEGAEGKQYVNLHVSTGFSEASKKLDFMNGTQYAMQINERQQELGLPPIFTQQDIQKIGAGTNWQNEILQKGLTQNYLLSFSGGTPKLRYYISGNYDNQNGIIRGSYFIRRGSRININSQVNQHLKIQENLMFTSNKANFVRTDAKGYGTQPGVITAIVEAPPTIPARDSNGNPTIFNQYPLGAGLENPLMMTDLYKQISQENRVIGNTQIDYEIFEGLSANVSLGYDIRDWRYNLFYPTGSAAAGGSNGYASINTQKNNSIVNSDILNYKKSINDIHNFDITAGFTYQTYYNEGLSASSRNFPTDAYLYNNLGAGSTPNPPGSFANSYTLLSYIGRVNYSYKDRYLITGTIRVDGDSKFGKNKKYGTFPAIALAWQLGDEKFIRDMNIFSNLKLRLSYGETGNESISPYQSLSLISISSGQYVFNGNLVPIAYPSNIPNPDLSWERAQEYDAGIDGGIINQRLDFTIDYYYKKTSALLLGVPLPTQSGYGSVLKNVGSMYNKGFEFSLHSRNLVGKFKWESFLNFSTNANKILSLGGAPYLYTVWVGDGNEIPHGRQVVRLQVGYPVGEFYGSVYDGIWKSQDEINKIGTMPYATPGSIRYKDVNGDGKYDTEHDDVFLGTGYPKWTLGFTNDFYYGNWSLHIFTYGHFGNKVLNLTQERFLYDGMGTSAKRVTERWSPSNPNGIYPAADYGNMSEISNAMDRVNSAIVQDGSFFRIANVTLSYNIKGRRFNGSSVSLSVDNLHVFTKYQGYDPEVNSYGDSNVVQGLDRYAYPASRTYRINFNFRF